MVELTGKKAYATGSLWGIGREIAMTLAKQGADVSINYVNSQDSAAVFLASDETGYIPCHTLDENGGCLMS